MDDWVYVNTSIDVESKMNTSSGSGINLNIYNIKRPYHIFRELTKEEKRDTTIEKIIDTK
jgi:hypothetical protein